MANLPLHSSRLAHLIYVPPRKSCLLVGPHDEGSIFAPTSGFAARKVGVERYSERR
jgi:hypothetical protein